MALPGAADDATETAGLGSPVCPQRGTSDQQYEHSNTATVP